MKDLIQPRMFTRRDVRQTTRRINLEGTRMVRVGGRRRAPRGVLLQKSPRGFLVGDNTAFVGSVSPLGDLHAHVECVHRILMGRVGW